MTFMNIYKYFVDCRFFAIAELLPASFILSLLQLHLLLRQQD